MKEFFNKFTIQRPIVYGVCYLGLIPLYAIAFTFLPESSLQLNNHNPGVFSNLYFSIITITTLGYGDITPVGKVGQMLTASESVLGIILIGLFLNSLSHQHGIEAQENEKQIQQERDKERAIERFSAFNQLVELKIKRYIVYLIPITTPISGRDTDTVNENFSFNDMKDLFKTTLRLTDNSFTPAIEYYFQSLKELVDSLEELVKLGYTQRWPEIESLCLEFIETSKELDFSAYILNQPNTRIGDKKGSDFDAEMIENHKGEVKFLPSNSINAYVALYHLIHKSFGFIKTYRLMASEIIKEKQDSEQ
jgi:hypothetical protein